MNWDAINAIAEIVGAIAVVVTLWYLALQMRQATHQAYADNLQAALTRWVDVQRACAETTEAAEFFRSALNDYDTLPQAEKLRFNNLMLRIFASFHAILALYQRKLLDEESFGTVENAIVGFLKCPGALAWYNEIRFSYPGSLVSHLDRAMETSEQLPLTLSIPTQYAKSADS